MHALLWVLQALVGSYFVAIGVMHFVVPDGLPEFVSWMYDLSPTQHTLAGVAEIAGGMGLILPSLTRIRPQLTVWAALGLIAVMIGAVVWHIGRGEYVNIGGNVVNIAMLGFIAYGRTKLAPIQARS